MRIVKQGTGEVEKMLVEIDMSLTGGPSTFFFSALPVDDIH